MRLEGRRLAIKVDGTHTCCYATQDKVWTIDPDGVPWEVYTVIEDTAEFGARSKLPGRGVKGTIRGIHYLLGNHGLTEETGVCNPDVEAILQRLENEAKTAIVLMTRDSRNAMPA